MNKRITSIVLSLVMLFTMLATAVPVLAATPVELKVTADTTSANPGDTINYKVSIGAVTDMGGLEFKLDIPSGLTIDDGSISIPDGLETTIDSDGAIIVPTSSNSYYWCYSAQLTGYTGISDLVILTFSCKVDDGITGTKTVSIKDVILIDQSVNDMDFSVTGSDVNVTPAPKPATGISLNKSTLELTMGENETLVATVEPADTTDTVVWTSSKESVATVDNTGKVTAVAPGTATITAKAGGFSDTCTVTVNAAVCAHTSKTPVAEKASDCTNKGWDAYQTCDDCGALFDTSGDPIEEIPYRALNDDHDFNTGVWGYQGDDGHAHVCTRNPAHHDTVEAHNFGSDDICDICGYERTHVCANHLTKVEEKLADCTNPGNIEHYKCSCGKLYEDATAARELTEEDVNRGALGHDWIDATCTEPKTCDRCGETEGTALGHDWEGEWSSNADNHWHACTRCDAKDGEGAHNPGAPATETTPQTCTVCDYEIAPATDHVCASHLTKVEAKPADCTNPGNIEHYKCSGDTGCGKLYEDADALVPTTAEEVKLDALGHDWKAATCTDPKTCDRCHTTDGDALGHDWADTWSKDEHNHWHACTRCDAKADEAAHTPDHPDGATTEYPILCVECGYEMEAQLEEGDIRIELPFMLTVKKTGELDPNAQTFSFVAEEFGAPVDYTLVQSTLDTNGERVYNGSFVFTIRESNKDNLREGFVFRQVRGSAAGWTYDETKFYAVPIYNENGDGVEFWNIYYLDEEAEPSAPSAPAATAVPTNSNVPQTGDDSNLAFWIVLLLAGGCGAVIAGFRKKGNSDEE